MLVVGLLGAGWLWHERPRLPDVPLTPPRLFTPRYRSSRAGRIDPSPDNVARGQRAAERSATADSSARVTIVPGTRGRNGESDAAVPAPGDPRASVTGDRDAPRLAIVIDDLGESLAVARSVLAIMPMVTVAVIPHTAEARAVAAAAVEAGREVILHLPLEPEGRGAMRGGTGFLETGMSTTALDRQLERDLRAVPYIIGVNGHMGSRFTSDPVAMEALLGALRQRGLFFLDSRTSPRSVAAPIAARLGVPFAERSVFLDHDPDAAAVERQLASAVAIAQRHGVAIAIGHPHPATIAVLSRRLPDLARDGVRVVPASMLTRHTG